MAEHEATARALEVIEAFNVADWPRLRGALSPDVVYEETGTGRRVEGADAYVALCKGWKEAFPDARGTVRRALADGDTGVLELTWEATQTGPLATPAGTIPPSGKHATVAASFWATGAGERCREIHHHLDVLALLQQIGAMP